VNRLAGRRLVATSVFLAVAAIPSMWSRAAPGSNGPPPTPGPDGRPSPFPQELRTPTDPSRPPAPAASGAILADMATGAILYEHAPDTPRPIASLTKVMTALVVLDRAGLDDVVTVDPAAVFREGDFGSGSSAGLRAGERRTVEELLQALLLGSANDAAEALAIHVSGGVEAFVREMNRRARDLGMRRTEFRSPHGLDDRGRSTPRDLVLLAAAANEEPDLRRIAAQRFARIGAPSGPDRRIQNRNALLWLYPGAFGTKTGSTAGAGPSLMASASRDGRELVAVVLDAERDEPFSYAAALLDHGFEAFEVRRVIEAGQPMGTVALPGGTVTASAGGSLDRLVARGAEIRSTIRLDPDSAFPPAPGERLGRVVVRVDGRATGEVPLVASDVPPPEPVGGSWWWRAAVTVAGAVADGVRAIAGN
jgi:D-alanyl-D-alanine carboxypeptidase (penicillin-binding protein 5/6)